MKKQSKKKRRAARKRNASAAARSHTIKKKKSNNAVAAAPAAPKAEKPTITVQHTAQPDTPQVSKPKPTVSQPQKAPVSQTTPRVRHSLGAVFSKPLLLFSLLVLFGMQTTRKISLSWRTFYDTYLYHRFDKLRALSDSVRASRVQSFCIFTVLFLLLPMIATMRIGVSVVVDGEVLGYVETEDTIAQACSEIEENASALTGEPYTLDADISYSPVIIPQDQFLPEESVSDVIIQSVDSIASLSVLQINGETVAACATPEEVQNALDRVQAQYTDPADNNADVGFLESISVQSAQAPISLLKTEDALFEQLTTETIPAETYIATETDTLSEIAYDHDMATATLQALNPDIIPERLAPNTELILQEEKPLLSVQVTKQEEYTEEIPYITVTQENAQLAENTTQVVQTGSNGEAAICAEVTTVNGVEVERNILSRTVLSNATNQIINIGTKPTGTGTGALISPIAGGTITSGYKFRWGRMHKGIDYGCAVGTSVRAADNGKVILSQYSDNGYGYYIIIDHGNGMKTLYAHNSQLLVNVGDVVEQGQIIAHSGNTGNSTGPHCHFEVMINNENVNPQNYV